MTPQETEEFARLAWPHLTTLAGFGAGASIPYKAFQELVGLDHWRGPNGPEHVLSFILERCQENNMPPLSIVVVNGKTGRPGPGYWYARTGPRFQQDKKAVANFDWPKKPPF